ncbi:MAG: aspartate carbamoyltransferase [Clostridia bacterium]|nr:aspartate carbamoyltransferase [Clostridia bacterium]
MRTRHLIDSRDYSVEEIKELCLSAEHIKENLDDYCDACRTKIMATLFYEPSTRTQLSFQTAMLRLGGKVIGFSDASSSSVSKGESLRDTVKIVSGYSDITVIRHPVEGAAYAASLYSRTPVINAGDGGHQHPTQTLTDLFTIYLSKGTPDGLTVGLCGDLLNGRTVHSLINVLLRYSVKEIILISTAELKIPDYLKAQIVLKGIKYTETEDLEEVIPCLDVLYMTRIQKERFRSIEQYEQQSGVFVLTKKKLERAKKDLLILHPLPKVDEIDYDVDDDPRAMYFEQAENGMYMRMALVLELLKNKKVKSHPVYEAAGYRYCPNPRCISNHEKYLPKLVGGAENGEKGHCIYCDASLE